MKIKKPMTPADHFAAAREIIASSDYKIFTPNGRYYKQKLQLIAAKSYGTKSLFLLQLKNNILIVRGLPPQYSDRSIVQKMERELGIAIPIEKPLRRFSFEPWDAARLYVTPTERIEFDLFVQETLDTRLP